VTRQISRALAIGGSQTINLEPLGNTRLDTLTTVDVRIGKLFKFPNNRNMEATVDFDNLTNSATVWQVRTQTPATSFLNPVTGQRQTLTQFGSPVNILGPRTCVFRLSYRF
jgi:hypothetical protein